ncbi:MAG: FAD-dependent oxidoreductase, partial [Bacteroidetes bacterium]|nr:FAD-dependent oxidoreductase [Bacteroidota bacterium]
FDQSIPERQKDIFKTYETRFYRGGNEAILKGYQKELKDKILFNQQVISVEEDLEKLTVTVQTDQGLEIYHCQWLICSAPAPVAKQVLPSTISDQSQVFLNNADFKPGRVVAMGINRKLKNDFRYLITPDLPTSLIFTYPQSTSDRDVLIFYFMGNKAREIEQKTEEELQDICFNQYEHIFPSDLQKDEIVFTAAKNWPMMGVEITKETYQNFQPSWLRASSRIFLSGDYTYCKLPDSSPYGMRAAVEAGQISAEMILNKQAISRPPKPDIEAAYQQCCQKLEELAREALDKPMAMECIPPFNKKPYPQGDLVPKGILLYALKQSGIGKDLVPKLEDYLISQQQNGLWPFHSGRLVTAMDTALVVLGLSEDVQRKTLGLLERFRSGEGYLPQLWTDNPNPKPDEMRRVYANQHWCQPDYGTTSLIAALRAQNGLPIDREMNFLQEHFEHRSGLFIANPYWLDWQLAMCLRFADCDHPLRVALAAEVLSRQNEDGTFGQDDLAFSTALGVLCLRELRMGEEAQEKGRMALAGLLEEGLMPVAVPFCASHLINPEAVTPLQFQVLMQSGADRGVRQVEGHWVGVSYYLDIWGMVLWGVVGMGLG